MGPVDAADLLGMAKDGITFLAEKKQATVEVSVDKDVPVVLSDEEKLRRVVENLVSNAVKFIDAGGHVRLKGSYDFTARALSLAVSGRRVRHRAGRPAARVQPLRPGKPAGRRRRPLLRQQRAGACPGQEPGRTAGRHCFRDVARGRGQRLFRDGARRAAGSVGGRGRGAVRAAPAGRVGAGRAAGSGWKAGAAHMKRAGDEGEGDGEAEHEGAVRRRR